MKTDQVLKQMVTRSIDNYISPGLISHLVAVSEKGGMVRMFENTREQMVSVTPHSHRFDLTCIVLEGEVRNTIFNTVRHQRNGHIAEGAEAFVVKDISYCGGVGKYREVGQDKYFHTSLSRVYKQGDIYSMTYDQIHSIWFSKGAKVLIIEGVDRTNTTKVLLPIDKNGVVIDTMKVEDWMFKDK